MNLRKISVIIAREFSVRVKKKSFIIMTIVTPVLFAALMVVPGMIMLYSGDTGETRKIMVLDGSGKLSGVFEEGGSYTYIYENGMDAEYVKANFDSLGIYAMLEVSPADENGNVTAVTYSRKQLNSDFRSSLVRQMSSEFQKLKLEKYEVDNLPDIMRDASYRVPLVTVTLGEDGKEKVDMVEIYMVISYIAAFLIYMFVFMFGSMVMRGVIEEKSNRIIEVIISSVKPVELMLGKITGVALVALTQFFIWVVFAGLLIAGAKSYIGIDEVQSLLSSGGALHELQNLDMTAVQKTLMDNPDAMRVFEAVSGIDYWFIIISFVIYFVFGYLLYAAMFAAVGSAVDNEADTQQFMMPITIPLVLGLFIMMHTFNYPDSPLSFWASIIPFTSPMVMMARVPFGVPAWEYVLSIVLLVLTFFAVAYVSAKIYRVGILTYGRKPGWKDLLKWMKYR